MTSRTDTLAEMRRITAAMVCTCFGPGAMEWDPAGPCPRCQLLAMLDALTAKDAAR